MRVKSNTWDAMRYDPVSCVLTCARLPGALDESTTDHVQNVLHTSNENKLFRDIEPMDLALLIFSRLKSACTRTAR